MTDDNELDEALLHEMVAAIGGSFALSGREAIGRYINDDRVSPVMMTMAVVRAHFFGAASMVVATTPEADPLEVAAWLLQAFGDALAEVRASAVGSAA